METASNPVTQIAIFLEYTAALRCIWFLCSISMSIVIDDRSVKRRFSNIGPALTYEEVSKRNVTVFDEQLLEHGSFAGKQN